MPFADNPTGSYLPPPLIRGFTLQRRIGVGGHGAVWAARRNADGRPACIKLAKHSDANAAVRWLREIDCQRRAGNAIAAEILGCGAMGDGAQWLAMARVQGDTLAAAMTARPVPWSCAAVAAAMSPVIASVAALHERGIVHADLKPENVIITCGRAVLLDFGSACPIDGHTPPGLGTAEYAAPERCTAPIVALPASDVYALAAMTYELLTGAPPFFGPEEVVLEAQRYRRPTALERHRLPRELDLVLRAALAKDPRGRTASAARFGATLLPCLLAGGEAIGTASSAATNAAARPRRDVVPLVWLRSDAAPSKIDARIARYDGALVHARAGAMVLAFAGGGSASKSAIAAARALLAEGVCERALVDVDEVVVRSDRGILRVFSPRFGFAARYPDVADPVGLAFTIAGAELCAGASLTAMAHRRDRMVLAEADVPPMPELSLHGREDLLNTLLVAAGDAIDQPTLATIVGERGSGRTRFAMALCDRLRDTDEIEIVHVRAPAANAAGGTALLLRELLELPPTPTCTDLSRALGCLPRHVPLGLLLALEAADAGDPAVAAMRAAPGAIRICIAAAIADAIVTAASHRPLAIVIDDADHADAALLDALETATLAERSAALFVAVVGRETLASDRADWSRRAGRSIALHLEPLDLDTTAELVREGLQPAINVPDSAVAEMHRRTRGLPQLLVELVSTLRNGGALRRLPESTGWTFATDVLQRAPDMPLAAWMAGRELDRLSPALARHAAVVATMGPDTEPRALESALRELDPGDDPLPTELDPTVAAERLVAAGILRREPHGLAFRHEALRDHAAMRLDPAARRRLHLAALEASAADDLTAPALAARLHHAVGAELNDEATTLALTLARLAGRRHAYLEAERHFGLAHAHAREGSDEARAARHGRGLMRFRLGRHGDAREDLGAVANAEASANERFDALLDAATVDDWCEDFERAEAAVRTAEALDVDASPLRTARLALARGRVAFRCGQLDEAVTELGTAAALAHDLGDDGYETRVIALLLLAPLLGMTGHVDRSLPLFDELFALCEEHSDRIHLATAFLNRPFVWMELGRDRELHEDLERVISISRGAGFPLLESRARHNLGELAYLRGDVATALQHVRGVVELEERLGGADRLQATHLLEARCRLHAGDHEAAMRVAESIRTRPADLVPSDEILCRMVELACNDADTATWTELVARSEADSVQQEHIEVLEIAGLAAAARGDLELARTWLERAGAVAATIPTVMRARIDRALASIEPLDRAS